MGWAPENDEGDAIEPRTASADDLTIVIPVYRAARYLPATIASAVAGGDWPLLIVDDQSPDESYEIALRWRDRFPNRIRVERNARNLGMTGNWNHAFRQVASRWAMKLDADDVVMPGYVAAMLRWLRSHGDVAIAGADKTIIGSDEFLAPDTINLPPYTATPALTPLEGREALRFLARWKPYPCSSSTFYRLDAFREVRGFDERLGWCSDWEIWFRLARHWPIAFEPRPAILYRMHAENVTTQTGKTGRMADEIEYMANRARLEWSDVATREDFRPVWRLLFRAHGATLKKLVRSGNIRGAMQRAALVGRSAWLGR